MVMPHYKPFEQQGLLGLAEAVKAGMDPSQAYSVFGDMQQTALQRAEEHHQEMLQQQAQEEALQQQTQQQKQDALGQIEQIAMQAAMNGATPEQIQSLVNSAAAQYPYGQNFMSRAGTEAGALMPGGQNPFGPPAPFSGDGGPGPNDIQNQLMQKAEQAYRMFGNKPDAAKTWILQQYGPQAPGFATAQALVGQVVTNTFGRMSDPNWAPPGSGDSSSGGGGFLGMHLPWNQPSTGSPPPPSSSSDGGGFLGMNLHLPWNY